MKPSLFHLQCTLFLDSVKLISIPIFGRKPVVLGGLYSGFSETFIPGFGIADVKVFMKLKTRYYLFDFFKIRKHKKW